MEKCRSTKNCQHYEELIYISVTESTKEKAKTYADDRSWFQFVPTNYTRRSTMGLLTSVSVEPYAVFIAEHLANVNDNRL